MKTITPNPAGFESFEIPNYKKAYLDVRGNSMEIVENLRNLLISLEDDSFVSDDREIVHYEELFSPADSLVYQKKREDLLNPQKSQYTIAEFDENYESTQSVLIVQQLLPFLRSIGIDGRVSPEGGEINFPQTGNVIFDSEGKIQETIDPELVGKDIFHFISCHIHQDLAVVLKRKDEFVYASDISRFEKTPKNENGKNMFLGKNIVDFHSAAPNFGKQLGPIFQKLINAFETKSLDMLTVDLFGQKIIEDAEFNKIRRFERDTFIPLRGDNDELQGFIGVANVFFQNTKETMSPYEGGESYELPPTQLELQTKNFVKRISSITNSKISDELLQENLSLERKIEIIQTILKNKDLYRKELLNMAAERNLEIAGGKLNLYGISYISDKCVNDCSYCGHNCGEENERSTLTDEEMNLDFRAVLKHQPHEFCILAGEYQGSVDDYCRALKILNQVNKESGEHLQRISLNVAPLSEQDFGKIVAAHSGDIPLQYRLFQESYDPQQYAKYHHSGPKRDFESRITAQDRALKAGFDEVGIGVLMGLNTNDVQDQNAGNDFEILSLIQHAHQIKEKHGRFPTGLSIPRHQTVSGSNFETPSPVDDDLYIFYHALLKLALPETNLIITSRETSDLIKKIEPYINTRDLAPRPGVGGNFRPTTNFQNELGDTRTAEEIIQDLKKRLRL